jgi:hypothetical protein
MSESLLKATNAALDDIMNEQLMLKSSHAESHVHVLENQGDATAEAKTAAASVASVDVAARAATAVDDAAASTHKEESVHVTRTEAALATVATPPAGAPPVEASTAIASKSVVSDFIASLSTLVVDGE